MLVLHQTLREQRKKLEMTQEEVAAALGVAPQTVSKWERAETCPDIALLPALAHLFGITTDELLGMEQFRAQQQLGTVYTQAREKLRRKDWAGAIEIYENALCVWPNDAGILTDLAMALALSGAQAELARAQELCLHVLRAPAHVKVQHTARAALCYTLAKAGRQEKAQQCAKNLPHQRESREVVVSHLSKPEKWDACLFTLSTGEAME